MVAVKGLLDPGPQQVMVDLPATSVSVDVDMTDLRTLLTIVGWPDAQIDMAQAIAQAEAGDGKGNVFSDAVGDTTLIDVKWGCSIGMFQIRSLRHPPSFGGADIWRWAYPLRQPFYNAQAAYAITNGGDWSKWSTFTSGAYKPFLGQSPKIVPGHARANEWWK